MKIKGIKLDHGYVQVRIFNKGETICKNFGKDCEYARNAALVFLGKKRQEIIEERAGIAPKLGESSFKDAAYLWFDRWSRETDANGQLKHNDNSVKTTKYRLEASVIPYFSRYKTHEIKPKHIELWRKDRLKSVTGSTANREQVIIQSMYNDLKNWMAGEKIAAFKLPSENPCKGVDKSSMVKRDRVVTPYEISKLKLAARDLGDENGRDNISITVKTCLSLKDLMQLKLGDIVNLNRSKTGQPVYVPITVMHQPNWKNWRGRWEAIRAKAGLSDIEFRDLRKAGGNLLLGRHDIKLVSQYMGHATQKTTESFYAKLHTDKMQALAQDLSSIVDSL